MSSEVPNFSPVASFVVGIPLMTIPVTLFFLLPLLTRYYYDLAAFSLAILPIIAGFASNKLAMRWGVQGQLTGIVAGNIAITIPSAIGIGYYMLFLSGNTFLQKVGLFFQYVFVLIFLILVVSVAAMAGVYFSAEKQSATVQA